MKTNKTIFQQSKDVVEIIDACEKISQSTKLTQRGGYSSVQIGTAYVYIKENEDTEIYDNIQYAQLYLHIGKDEKGFLRANGIKFFDNTAYGGIREAKYVNKDNIASIRLFEDAYERIMNKIIAIDKYCNDIDVTNKKQVALMETI